jgi:glycosyltransferase involved in cell wall biosynthesis
MKILSTTSADTSIKALYSNLPKSIICFSHLRWDFVFQRPQHLLTRFGKTFEILFMEEPVYDADDKAYYSRHDRGNNIQLMVPHLPAGVNETESITLLKLLFDQFMLNRNLSDLAFWYYTPMALEFTRKYSPDLIIYDCMDELSAFKFAPEALKGMEQELLKKADIVFTGGQSLYEAKKNQHANIHPFPSSIDKKHFEKARQLKNGLSKNDANQPKLGYYGVIDERFDIDLIGQIAELRPNWQIILIGPVVKIDHAALPKNSNIHYIGGKNYSELPSFIASWDVALIPFLLNESTRYISPTKTPEYLAAGIPVVSTPIRDVISPYGKQQLVSIARNAEEFVAAIEDALPGYGDDWLTKVDSFLSQQSWDKTCEGMLNLVKQTIANRSLTSIAQ